MQEISPDGMHLITEEEGFVAHVTPDSQGYPSIGYGHLLAPGESFPDGITREQALALKRRDLVRFEAAVRKVSRPITQRQYDALVSLAYNIGVAGFARSLVRASLERGDEQRAADLMLVYCTAANAQTHMQNVDLILAGRRWRERACFLGRPLYAGGWASRESWRDYQRVMAALGGYGGPIDGIPGARTLAGVCRVRDHVKGGGSIPDA